MFNITLLTPCHTVTRAEEFGGSYVVRTDQPDELAKLAAAEGPSSIRPVEIEDMGLPVYAGLDERFGENPRVSHIYGDDGSDKFDDEVAAIQHCRVSFGNDNDPTGRFWSITPNTEMRDWAYDQDLLDPDGYMWLSDFELDKATGELTPMDDDKLTAAVYGRFGPELTAAVAAKIDALNNPAKYKPAADPTPAIEAGPVEIPAVNSAPFKPYVDARVRVLQEMKAAETAKPKTETQSQGRAR